MAADFLIRLHFDHSQEDYMDLRVGMVDGDGRFTPKYLPAVLSPALDEWLRTAILKGAVDEGFSSTRVRSATMRCRRRAISACSSSA